MNKSDIEELISGYLDDRLSQRQHTEVKRLLQHDKIFAQKFARVEKQRNLLRAMPKVSAPENMFDDIKHFLDRTHHTEQVVKDVYAGSRQLVWRKVLTSAAMFALVGLLGVVVYNILMPVSPSSTKKFAKTRSIHPASETIDISRSKELAATGLAGAYPMNASLKLATNDIIEMNSLIEKAIYNNGLLDYTVPHRQTKTSTYHLTCSADGIVAFLSDLDVALSRCRDAELTVFGRDMLAKVVIEDVSAVEVADFYRNDPSSDHIRFAKQIDGFKRIVKDMPLQGITAPTLLDGNAIFDDITMVKPVLTSGGQQDIMRQLYEEDHCGDVNLMVIVSGF